MLHAAPDSRTTSAGGYQGYQATKCNGKDGRWHLAILQIILLHVKVRRECVFKGACVKIVASVIYIYIVASVASVSRSAPSVC